MKKDYLIYVKIRLAQWAEWYSQNNLYGIGFSSTSIEYRLMTEGTLINSTAPRQFKSNLYAEEIEALVKEIGHYEKMIEVALRIHYFEKSTMRECAKKLGLSFAYFRMLVSQGQIWLAGRLSAYKENYMHENSRD